MIMKVILIDQQTGRRHDLGVLDTSDPDLSSLVNRGQVVKLLRKHRHTVHPAHAEVLAYDMNATPSDGQFWQVRTLLNPVDAGPSDGAG